MAAAATSPTLSRPGGRWILSPALDGALIIGAPLLILPILFGLATVLPPVAIAGFVLVILSTAHHLPGFLRVYGDPVLFQRYRLRFLLIPPLVLGCVWWLTSHRLTAILLISLAWAVWHGLMQVYGVMRIYAAKAGERSTLTSKLDRSMCLSGFVAVLLSGGLVGERIIAAAEGTGLFGTRALLGETASTLAWAVFGAVAVVYVAHHAWRLGKGLPVSWLKLGALAISLVYVYFCWAVAGLNLLLGLAAFEAFHDVQYMAVAWAYNQRLVASGSGNRMLNYLFRPRAALVGLYCVVISAYGGIAFAAVRLGQSDWQNNGWVILLAALVATSGLLHFYFDGFIWKVRQKKTQRDLGIGGDAAARPEDTGFPSYSPWKEAGQAVLLAVVILGLGVLALNREAVELPARGALARTFPASAALQIQLGAAYQKHGRIEEAADAYRAALGAQPGSAVAHHGLGSMYAMQGRNAEAVAELREALANDPTRLDSASVLANLLMQGRRLDEAERVLRDALAHAPDSPVLTGTLAQAILMDSSDPARIAEAAHLAMAASRATGFQRAPALMTLARAQAAQGRYDAAIQVLRRARGTAEAQSDPALRSEIVRLLVEYRSAQSAAPPSR